MPRSHLIALLAVYALSLAGLKYVCHLIAIHGGIIATVAVISALVIAAEWLEPTPAPPPEPPRE